MQSIKNLIFIYLVLILFSGCITVYNPATGKNELILINTTTEVVLGKRMVEAVKEEYKISDEPSLNNLVNSIGREIALQSDRQDLNYNFYVVEDKELNAFTLPGGFIFVNSGLIDRASDDELACVIAHEVGHIAAKHPIKRLQANVGYQVIMSIVLSKTSSVNLYRVMDVFSTIIVLGYSRQDEKFADKLAVKYAYKAGFNPHSMITFFKKLKAEKDKEPQLNLVFLSSHPPIDERIRNVRDEIDIIEGKKESPRPKNYTNPKNNLSDTPGTDNKSDLTSNLVSSQKNIGNITVPKTKKICPKCKKIYPNRYNFCPKDGNKL